MTVTFLKKKTWLQQAAHVLLREMVDDYTQGPYPGGGQMTISIYDTAWVALLRDPIIPNQLAFPRSFLWLLQSQAVDGSWGGRAPYSFLSTMGALLALLKAPDPYRALGEEAAQSAHAYLNHSLPTWSITSFESIGFELLVPTLLAELESVGVLLGFPAQEELMRLYSAKLAVAPLDALSTGFSTLLHSLEAFGTRVDIQQVKPLQATNGSYGCSPAATAAALLYGPWDPAAASWLHHLSQLAFENAPGAMPNVHPTDVFDTAWSLCLLAQGNQTIFHGSREYVALHHQLINWLHASLSSQGASMSQCQGMPQDADDTSMTIAALHAMGYTPSLEGLRQFERVSHFVCYDLERNSSTSVNAHVLSALLSAPAADQTTMQSWANQAKHKLVTFLYGARHAQGFWNDKFFLGPYYGTFACVQALAAHPDEAVRAGLTKTTIWLLEAQSSIDGGWGVAGSTLEETAYAVLSLFALQKSDVPQPVLTVALRKGLDYLWRQLPAFGLYEFVRWPRYEKLWLGKELYAPQRIVTAAILAALSGDPDCLTPASTSYVPSFARTPALEPS